MTLWAIQYIYGVVTCRTHYTWYHYLLASPVELLLVISTATIQEYMYSTMRMYIVHTELTWKSNLYSYIWYSSQHKTALSFLIARYVQDAPPTWRDRPWPLQRAWHGSTHGHSPAYPVCVCVCLPIMNSQNLVHVGLSHMYLSSKLGECLHRINKSIPQNKVWQLITVLA